MSSHIMVRDWLANCGSRITEITAGGLKLDRHVVRLPQVMATYSVAHRGFNPNAATITDAPNGPGSPSRPPSTHQY
jgi:hypothetical protein